MKLTIDLKNGTQLPACTVSRVEVMTDGSVRLYVDTSDDPADARMELDAAFAKLGEKAAGLVYSNRIYEPLGRATQAELNGPDEATKAALTEPNALTESLELERKRLQRDTDRSLMGKATSGGKKKDK